jgi:hypothetical protein
VEAAVVAELAHPVALHLLAVETEQMVVARLDWQTQVEVVEVLELVLMCHHKLEVAQAGLVLSSFATHLI